MPIIPFVPHKGGTHLQKQKQKVEDKYEDAMRKEEEEWEKRNGEEKDGNLPQPPS
jgi:hypothetical protein